MSNSSTEGRKVKYISPSSWRLFKGNPQAYFVKYFCGVASGETTPAMQTGLDFDVAVKRRITAILNGEVVNSVVNEYLKEYASSGALADLCLELSEGVGWKMEYKVEANIRIGDTDVPFLGYPDLSFFTKDGTPAIVDFKWTGGSPSRGYTKCRTLQECGAHRDAFVQEKYGVGMNVAEPMESYSPDWADQLCIYAWMLGAHPGSPFVAGIEQVCKASKTLPVRVVSYRGYVSIEHQLSLLTKLAMMWECVLPIPERNGQIWFFRDLSFEDSLAKQEALLSPEGDLYR